MMRRLWYAQTISVFGDFLALFALISVLTFRVHANALTRGCRKPAPGYYDYGTGV
jgi:hypothetical protein